jgi:Domain of unknown function (DUF1707)
MPNDDPQLRASDDDRDRTASLLREHHAAGRLNVDEFQERLDATYEAKTLGHLQELLADLPSIDLYHLPEQSMRRSQHEAASQPSTPAEHHSRLSAAWRNHWGSWFSVSMVLFVIWLIGAVSSHHLQGLWFLWVSGPWGAILLSRWIFGQHPDGGHGPGQIHGGVPGVSQHGQQHAQLEDHKERIEQAFEERRQRLDEHLQRHQDRMQDHMQRQQDHMQRQQDRLQRHQDRIRRPGDEH